MTLISKESLLAKFESGALLFQPDIRKIIQEEPEVDAEPVVRCEFCEKHGKALDCPYSISTGELPDPQDYCSMGVRKKMKGGTIDG